MAILMKPSDPDLLIFEPQIGGHRLTWLQYITEDFLHLGYSITWAVDLRTESKRIIQERLAPLLTRVSMMSVFNEDGGWRGGSKIKSLAECQKISRSKQVFVNELDEFISNVLRRAALGIYPPTSLKGRLNGVYFRPRFLTDPVWPPGNIIKASGFRHLCKQQWFQHIYVLDEYLISSPEINSNHFHFLPDLWSGDYSCSSEDARRALDIPLDKFVFLHYGIGDRRKGLHLVVAAMEKMATGSNIFLLCAGQIDHDPALLKRIETLEKRRSAKLINRYVSDEEERFAFSSADVVLLPYIHHYGSSGVLSRAAAAGKMVIASDEGLLAKRIREHDLGFLFPTNNINELQQRMVDAALLNNERRAHFRTKSLNYAKTCSRETFRNALISPWSSAGK
jgi:glycosyltransferase involved in cell wall biosynthesis